MSLMAEHVLAALKGVKDELLYEGEGDDVLSKLGELMGVKHLKPSESLALRYLLCEMAALGHIELFFDSDAVGARIVVIMADAESKPYLREQVAAALTAKMEAEAAAAQALEAQQVAEELLGEAIAEHRTTLQQLDQLQTELAQAEVTPSVVVERQVVRPPSQSLLAGLRARATTAEKRVEELRVEISALRRTVRLAHRGYVFHKLSCGCTVARVDSKGCTIASSGGHPWFPLVIPGVKTVAEGQLLIASWMAGGPPAMLLGSDVQPKPLRS